MSLLRRPPISIQRILTPILWALLCLAGPLGAVGLAQQGEAEVQDDIEFAKGLAREWGFVDLASEVIREIERGGVSARTGELLGVVKCDIYAQAALAERDRERRNELFEFAMAAYEDFPQGKPQLAKRSLGRGGLHQHFLVLLALPRDLDGRSRGPGSRKNCASAASKCSPAQWPAPAP